MLQSLLASGERVGQEKAYTAVVVVGGEDPARAKLRPLTFSVGRIPVRKAGIETLGSRGIG
jgi:hypothetical protein